MIKRLILVCMVVLLAAPFVSAQLWKMKRYEATAGLGTSQFYGDIGGFSLGKNAIGFKDITFKQTRFNVNGSFRYYFTDNVAARLSFSYIMLYATDVRGSNELRNYAAVTSLFEPLLVGEYYVVRNRERNSFLFQTYRGRARNRLKDFFRSLDVYAMTGVGGAGFNVHGNDKLEQRWSVNPEQQSHGFIAVIPVGLGVKLAFDPNILLGVELAGRYTFSDFLDGYDPDVPLPADPDYRLRSLRNDVYHTFSVTFNYRIKTARNGLPSFR
ncbi:MAG: DUF6089 family protein [Bacteroidales bacterium]|nr:DUF6089 family protein [Bacteroidales bacterium]MDT8374018.1 DUF6089 family protein [Bacteroidales bacterium]